MRTSSSTGLGYRPELDGIRALAVIAVMFLHSWGFLPALNIGGTAWHYKGGFLGVDVFFVLSGYLITTLLLREREGTGGIGLRNFYARRALRLLPALFVLLIFGAFVVSVLGSNLHQRAYPKAALATLLYVANWAEIHGPGQGILGHTWTLAIEEQYYIVWPLLLLVAVRFIKSRRALAGLLVLSAVGVAVLRYIAFTHGKLVLASESTFTRTDGIILGSALALALSMDMPLLRRVLEKSAVAIVAAAFVVGYSLVVSAISKSVFSGGLFAVNFATALLIGHLTVRPVSAPKRLLSIQPLPALGRISYGIYLFHPPINRLLHEQPLGMRGTRSVALMFVLSIGAAILSYVLVERPVLRLKKRFGSRSQIPEMTPPEVAATTPAEP